MILNDPDEPVLVAGRLVLAAIGLGMIVFGVRIAVTRQMPRPRMHFGRSTAERRPRPVSFGGGAALLGASMLLRQVALLFSMPSALVAALLALGLVLFITAVGWFFLRRD